jgi:hypothetical protein
VGATGVAIHLARDKIGTTFLQPYIHCFCDCFAADREQALLPRALMSASHLHRLKYRFADKVERHPGRSYMESGFTADFPPAQLR